MSTFSPWEHDYIGLTEVSSLASTRTMTSHQPIPSSSSSSPSSPLDIKETELRLGLPGSHFPGRKRHPAIGSVPAFGLDSGYEDILPGMSLNQTRTSASGAKRGFFDAVDGCCGKGRGVSGALKSQGCVSRAALLKDIVVAIADRNEGSNELEKTKDCRPAAKAQVVGWPPIQSFRKNATASALVNDSDDVNGKSGVAGCPFVKVGMDGAPYLRKVDLRNYKTYAELLIGLEQMFSCITLTSGTCASEEHPGGGIRLERQLSDLVSSSEYVLTYEDKEGDWMLVGDVPWRMFAESCRRVRIMKGYEAIRLALRFEAKHKKRG